MFPTLLSPVLTCPDGLSARRPRGRQTVLEAAELPGAGLVDDDGLWADVAVQHAGLPVQEPQALRNLQRQY